jgi:trehalose/maltose hydrolase-like predicted phosphorylase
VSVNQIAILDETNYAKFYSRSHEAVIRVYNEADNVIETHEQAGVQRLVARLSVFPG